MDALMLVVIDLRSLFLRLSPVERSEEPGIRLVARDSGFAP